VTTTARTWRLFIGIWSLVLILNLAAVLVLSVGDGGAWWQFVVPGLLIVISAGWLSYSVQRLRTEAC
jgi:hypothetical protein